ncbi:hypothetical protein M8C21_009261, partial [Ambrosia artemisiifolia]
FKDQLLPSKDEAQRLKKSLRNCRICIVKGNDHKFLLKRDNNLLTLIKGSAKYRRTSYHDSIKDYIPPNMSEFRTEYEGHSMEMELVWVVPSCYQSGNAFDIGGWKNSDWFGGDSKRRPCIVCWQSHALGA